MTLMTKMTLMTFMPECPNFSNNPDLCVFSYRARDASRNGFNYFCLSPFLFFYLSLSLVCSVELFLPPSSLCRVRYVLCLSVFLRCFTLCFFLLCLFLSVSIEIAKFFFLFLAEKFIAVDYSRTTKHPCYPPPAPGNNQL